MNKQNQFKEIILEISKYSKAGIFLAFLCAVLFFTACSDKTENWEIDNLEEIGGHAVTVFGNPEVVETEIGKAIKFDGDGDMLLVDFNPIGSATEFTVEVVFKPDASFPNNTAPRFIHIQDPDDSFEKRLMIELRLTEQNKFYFDGFLKTDTGSLALIDKNLLHSTEKWVHAAVSYKDHKLTTYINGKKQLTGKIAYDKHFINPTGKVAIGGRMNKVSWFSGMIKTLKVTQIALKPEHFMSVKNE